MEDPQTAVRDDRRLGWVGRDLPLKRAVMVTSALDVLAQIRPGIYQLSIGLFQPTLTIGVVERGTFRKHVADGRVDGAGEQAVGFLETSDDFRSHTGDERERARRFRT